MRPANGQVPLRRNTICTHAPRMSTSPTPRSDRRTAGRAGFAARVQDALYAAVRWSVTHGRGLYAELGLFFVLGLMVAGAATAVVALLADRVAGGATQAFDEAVIEWMRGRRSGFLDALAIAGAGLGSGAVAWAVLGIATLVLWSSRHRLSLLILWIAVVGGRILSTELKSLYDRPRPTAVDWRLEVFGRPIPFPESPSFPSGHALTSMVVFGTLAYLITRLEPTVALRRITLTAAVVVIGTIGVSRIYLGVHYPSDVVAGYLAGFVWATFSAFAIEVVRYAAAFRPEVRRTEHDVDRGMDPVRSTLHRRRS